MTPAMQELVDDALSEIKPTMDDATEATEAYGEKMRRLHQVLGLFDAMGVPPIISDTISMLARGDVFGAAMNAGREVLRLALREGR